MHLSEILFNKKFYSISRGKATQSNPSLYYHLHYNPIKVKADEGHKNVILLFIAVITLFRP